MKKFNLFFGVVLFSCIAAFVACSDDDDGGSSNPNNFCDEGLCADNATRRAACVDAYNDCILVDKGEDDDCKVVALSICNI